MKRLIVLIMLTTAANFGQMVHADTDPPSQVRITSSFEYKYTGAVLKKVAKLFSKGFVRADAKLRHIPFIMVTAESKTENVVAAGCGRRRVLETLS